MIKEIIKEYRNELNEILDALKYCSFDQLDYTTFEDDFVYDFQQNYNKDFINDSGATKGVLIFKNFNFVIKIPFSFCDGEELCGVYEGNNNWDYCSQEITRYEMASEEGFGELFLEIYFLGFIHNYPIYIQPYANNLKNLDYIDDFYSIENTENLIKKVSTINEQQNNECINIEWEVNVFMLYGEQFFINFKKYLKENHISDLRDANIGYINKKPILIDYARIL